MNQSKSSALIKILFFIAICIIATIGGIAYQTIKDLSKSSDLLLHTYKVNVELEQIMSYLKDSENGQRGFIIMNDSLYLKPYLDSRELINNSFAELKELTRNSKEQQNDLRVLSGLISRRLSNFEKSSRFSTTNDLKNPKFYPTFLEGKVLMDSIRLKIATMITNENAKLSDRQNNYESHLILTPVLLFSLLLLSIGLVLLAYYKVSKDLRNLKLVNEELEIFKESANQSEIISRNGNWIWNIESNTFKYSDNLYRLLGEQPQSFEPTLENFIEFVHPEDLPKLQEDIDKMMKEEHLPFIHYRIIQKNGNVKYFKAYGQVLEIEEVRQLIGTTSDVTDEIENYKLLEDRNRELERNNKELSAFNHVASHDLQEPLRKIQTFLSRLVEKESHNLSENGTKYISRIQTAAARMRLLIDDLLQFSRTNKAEKVLEIANINLLLEGAKQDLTEAISESNAIINSETFPVMKVIPFQIQQLFTNLISNSIKYKQDTINPIIDIKYERIDALDEVLLTKPKREYYHKITFSDNGIGFDNEYSEKIFTLFSRLHSKDKYSGTGIGLSICKKIVENHGGYIFAIGEENKGAVFKIFLPI